jgi:hypothetical protein
MPETFDENMMRLVTNLAYLMSSRVSVTSAWTFTVAVRVACCNSVGMFDAGDMLSRVQQCWLSPPLAKFYVSATSPTFWNSYIW